MASRYGQEKSLILLRRPYLISPWPFIGGFSVLMGAAHQLTSLPFSHRPPHLKTESMGIVPLPYSISEQYHAWL